MSSDAAEKYAFLNGTTASYVDAMYEKFKAEPMAVEESWRQFFWGFEFALEGSAIGAVKQGGDEAPLASKVEAFVQLYRCLGYLYAHINPLGPPPDLGPQMLPEAHGLAAVNHDEVFSTVNFAGGARSFSELWQALRRTYCGSIGVDYRDLQEVEAVVWLQDQMEPIGNSKAFTTAEKKEMARLLVAAEGFEKFLHQRYLGQKRFSLEGLDSLVPALHALMRHAQRLGVEECTLGMAHRGRLNVLANVLGKPYQEILQEFEGREVDPYHIDGDVKYHLGYSSEISWEQGPALAVYLCPNPSHLEVVSPVVEGVARRRQDSDYGGRRDVLLPILLHGDAAFIGQGVVAETLNLSQLEGYRTGGTVHVITNNQVGFTTDPKDSRSSRFSSDLCKLLRAPVFHVNADDVEAVCWVAQLAVAYRQRYQTDVVIDLVGFRRHGHNETDEPGFTQPLMVEQIKAHPGVAKLYTDRLISEGVIEASEVATWSAEIRDQLQQAFEFVRAGRVLPAAPVPRRLAHFFQYRRPSRHEVTEPVHTGVTAEQLEHYVAVLSEIPAQCNPHPKLRKLYGARRAMLTAPEGIDWGFAELLAFASLVDAGYRVRLSGQDCRRGTFSSRHAVIVDQQSGEPWVPMSAVRGGGTFEVINSPLSEQACVGFEFGYSVAASGSLVLWEAQFGDFANGAQIIIDQFLASSEAKWQQTSNLVLLLPHGFEGMGPEHSSARPERFLQLCGSLNMQVANVTTPAQLFHLLRAQALRAVCKPLILMSPKSLLRHPEVRSPAGQFIGAGFEPLLLDPDVPLSSETEAVLLCSGKIYYDLVAERNRKGEEQADLPVLRLERLYPFPFDLLQSLLITAAPALSRVVWVQEEPQNMGYWSFVRPRLRAVLPEAVGLEYVGRIHSGTTAEGSQGAHLKEQKRIVAEALGLACGWNPRTESDVPAAKL